MKAPKPNPPEFLLETFLGVFFNKDARRFTLPAWPPGIKFELGQAKVLTSVLQWGNFSVGDRCSLIQETAWLSEYGNAFDRNTRNFLRGRTEFVILGFVQLNGSVTPSTWAKSPRKEKITVEAVLCVLGDISIRYCHYSKVTWKHVITYPDSGYNLTYSDRLFLFFPGNLRKIK